MVLCWDCGADLPEQAKYCGRCGKQQKERTSMSPLSLPGTSKTSYGSDSEQTEQGIIEHEKATPVLLRQELRKQVLELWRQGKYDQLDTLRRELAREMQSGAVSALSRVLFDQAFDTLLPPQGSFGHHEPKEFPRAKELLSKEDITSREKGLELLMGLKAISAFHSHPLVEDWCLFAQALVHGLGYTVPKWQEKRKQGKASSEDTWNLAVFYAGQLDYKQALDVLRTDFDVPSLDKKHVSFAQLRFALYCAAKLSDQGPEAHDTAVSFLRSHLNKYPEPECFFLWMLLKEQAGQFPGADQEGERIKIWKTLYTLLYQTICIPELNKPPEKKDISSFVDQLQQLDFHETLMLWFNDYSRCPGTKFENLDNKTRQALVKAYEALGEVHQAGDMLYKAARRQSRIFQGQRGGNGAIPAEAFSYMRKDLLELFTFYKHHNILESKEVFERFKRLHREIPELWDNTREENKQLIALTRPLLEKVAPHYSEVKNTLQPPLVQPTEQPKDKKDSFLIEVARPDQPLPLQDSQILLSLQVSYRGSGEVNNILITVRELQGEQKALGSKRLDSLGQGETRVVNIPVALNSTFGQAGFECRADLIYRWNGEKRSVSQRLKKISLEYLDPLPHSHQENHHSEVRKRVGLFVDYENGSPLGRRREEQEVGKALISYAGQFGEVVCRWVIADPRNRKDWADAETRLKQAGFKIRYPSGEPSVGKAPKNVADLALIAQIYDELEQTRPDIYIIVSGDGDYYETIHSLLDRGKTVGLCAPLRQFRISEKYFELERERRSQEDFFIIDLNTALRVPGNKASGVRSQ